MRRRFGSVLFDCLQKPVSPHRLMAATAAAADHALSMRDPGPGAPTPRGHRARTSESTRLQSGRRAQHGDNSPRSDRSDRGFEIRREERFAIRQEQNTRRWAAGRGPLRKTGHEQRLATDVPSTLLVPRQSSCVGDVHTPCSGWRWAQEPSAPHRTPEVGGLQRVCGDLRSRLPVRIRPTLVDAQREFTWGPIRESTWTGGCHRRDVECVSESEADRSGAEPDPGSEVRNAALFAEPASPRSSVAWSSVSPSAADVGTW